MYSSITVSIAREIAIQRVRATTFVLVIPRAKLATPFLGVPDESLRLGLTLICSPDQKPCADDARKRYAGY